MTDDLDRHVNLILKRFKISQPPETGSDRYEESLTNWFLEVAFFRDFVCRNQKGKKGRGELADGLVLFQDTALFIQTKAQLSRKDGQSWAAKHLKKALRQVKYGERMLRERLISEVTSDTLGPLPFDPEIYHKRIGVIVLDQRDTSPFIASEIVPEIGDSAFPVHVFSLSDFLRTLLRFDTAPDFLWYLTERERLAVHSNAFSVHRESDVGDKMLEQLRSNLLASRPDVSQDVLDKSMEVFRKKLVGDLLHSDKWKFGILLDDVIAHLHDSESSSNGSKSGKTQMKLAIEVLSQLDRYRRIIIGEKMMSAATSATASGTSSFWHATKYNQCCYVFVFSDLPRARMAELLPMFLLRAMFCSDMSSGVVVGTNQLGAGGRAYDVAVRVEPLTDDEKLIGERLPDPFGT